MTDYEKAKYMDHFHEKYDVKYIDYLITDNAVYYKADKYIKIEKLSKKKCYLYFNLEPLFKEIKIGSLILFNDKNKKDELLIIIYSLGDYAIYSLIFEEDCVKYRSIYNAKETDKTNEIYLYKLNNEKILLFTDNSCSIFNIKTKQIETKINKNFKNIKYLFLENTVTYLKDGLKEEEIKDISLLNKCTIKYTHPKRNSILKNDIVLSADNNEMEKGKIKLKILKTNLKIEEKIIDIKLKENFEILEYFYILEDNNFYFVYSVGALFNGNDIYIGKYNDNNFKQRYIKNTEIDECQNQMGFFLLIVRKGKIYCIEKIYGKYSFKEEYLTKYSLS